jgi:hypothetical protein
MPCDFAAEHLMQLKSNSFSDGASIPAEFAFAAIAPSRRVALSHDRNPHLTWDDVPAGTQSFVLICHDPDVPSRGDDVNKEGSRRAAACRLLSLAATGHTRPNPRNFRWQLQRRHHAPRQARAGRPNWPAPRDQPFHGLVG